MKDINEFFEALGEVWRDITVIEFLMRCALAQKERDISKLPRPPYTKGRTYQKYPNSFSYTGFGDVVKEFNKQFPKLIIPPELIDLRNAMAHGIIFEINHSGTDELVKFKMQSNKTLVVEFSIPLEQKRLSKIRLSLIALRRLITREAADKPPN